MTYLGQNKNNKIQIKKYKTEKTEQHTCMSAWKKKIGFILISPKTVNQDEYYRKQSFDMHVVSPRKHSFVLGHVKKITL